MKNRMWLLMSCAGLLLLNVGCMCRGTHPTITWEMVDKGPDSFQYSLNGKSYGRGDVALMRVLIVVHDSYPDGTEVTVEGEKGLWDIKNAFPFPVTTDTARVVSKILKGRDIKMVPTHDYETIWIDHLKSLPPSFLSREQRILIGLEKEEPKRDLGPPLYNR